MNEHKNFPVIFGRKGGHQIKIISLFALTDINKSVAKLLLLEQRLYRKKDELLGNLYQEISIDKGKNKKLLNFKRDLFNSRNIEKYQTLNFTNRKIKILINEFNSLKKQYHEDIKIYCLFFEEQLRVSIKNFQKIVHLPFFKNGLIYASQIIYDEIHKTNFEYQSLNKKNKKLIVSILKYLTRSVTKTTPFSSFNNIFFLEQNLNGNYSYSSNKEEIQSFFQVNNLLFYCIKEILLGLYDFKKTLNIIVNTNIWEENNGKEIHSFVNKNNNESYKKLPYSSVLKFIRTEISSHKITYSELTSKLITITSKDIETVQTFVDTLIDEGILELIFPATLHKKNWVYTLKNYLRKNDYENNLIPLINALEIIDDTKSCLKLLSTEERKGKIEYAYKSMAETIKQFNVINVFTKNVKPQNLYYEDTLSQINGEISHSTYEKIKISLKSAYLHLNSISYKNELKKELSKTLNSKFNGKLPILTFYESIYLKRKAAFLLEKLPLKGIEKVIDGIQRINREKALQKEFIDLKELISPLSSIDDIRVSFGANIQPRDINFSEIVLNNFSKGNGANCSRFLNLCSDEIIDKIKASNINEKTIITDVKDASIHNTNIYPPVTDYLISICNNQNLKEDYKLLPLLNLYIIIDDSKGIILVNKSGEEITPIQFSFEGLNRKSKFTQFLDIFDPNENFGYTFLLESINNLYLKELETSNIVEIPRLYFSNNIIIQRKKWLVKKEEVFNILYSNDTSFSLMFYNLNKWKLKNGIPDEVFIKIKPRDINNPQDDHYKPQYIDFRIPVFVLLLHNIIKGAHNTITFSEMSPNTKDVQNNGGCVKEYIFNINE